MFCKCETCVLWNLFVWVKHTVICTYLFPILVVESTYVHKYMVKGRRDERHSKVSALSYLAKILYLFPLFIYAPMGLIWLPESDAECEVPPAAAGTFHVSSPVGDHVIPIHIVLLVPRGSEKIARHTQLPQDFQECKVNRRLFRQNSLMRGWAYLPLEFALKIEITFICDVRFFFNF